MRPYAPVHLRGVFDGAGDLQLSWIRRTRLDGDSWDGIEVPLSEDRESYLIRVLDPQGSVLRDVTVSSPDWVYPAGLRAVDGITGAYTIAVAQISDRFGQGSFERIALHD